VESGTALEINTSGMRHGMNHYFPPVDVVNAAKKAGVAVTYLGSDAHRPEQVAFEFEAASSLVPSAISVCED
jgi:histidinol-phosphatase (PHP family)